MQWKVLKRNWS